MLRLIVKICPTESKRYDGNDESINLSCYKVFEVEHDALEEYIKAQRDDGHPIKLVAIEVFEPSFSLPLAVPVPANPTLPGLPGYAPSDTSPAAQQTLKEKLAAKHATGSFWHNIWARKRYVPPEPVKLPG